MQHKAAQCRCTLAAAWGASLELEAKLSSQANKLVQKGHSTLLHGDVCSGWAFPHSKSQ